MIELSRESLIKALEPCARVADQRSTMPALAHVLLESDGKQLRYRATNLRHEVSGSVPCDGDGSFAVNARDLVGVLASLTGDTAKLSPIGKSRIEVKGKGVRSFKLPMLEAGEFPAAMNVGGKGKVLPAGLLSRMINSTFFSARHDLDRLEQAVVRIDKVNGKLRAAATNGLGMLAMLTTDSTEELSVSIPTETARLLADHDGEVTVFRGVNAMAFELGAVRVASSEPAGTFPPVDLAIESWPAAAGSVVVSAAALLDSVKAVRRACNDVCLRFGGSSIVLTALEANEAGDEVDVQGSAPEHESWLLADQLCGALGAVSGDITIEFGGEELAPIVLSQGGWKTWLMPMRAESVKAKRAA